MASFALPALPDRHHRMDRDSRSRGSSSETSSRLRRTVCAGAHGLFLARDDPSNARPWAAALRPRPLALVTLKLLAQPLVTALLAVYVFGMKGMNAQLVVILSALPTGTGAFMLADVYKRDLEVTSTTILVSTVASAVTLSICLVLLPRLF